MEGCDKQQPIPGPPLLAQSLAHVAPAMQSGANRLLLPSLAAQRANFQELEDYAVQIQTWLTSARSLCSTCLAADLASPVGSPKGSPCCDKMPILIPNPAAWFLWRQRYPTAEMKGALLFQPHSTDPLHCPLGSTELPGEPWDHPSLPAPAGTASHNSTEMEGVPGERKSEANRFLWERKSYREGEKKQQIVQKMGMAAFIYTESHEHYRRAGVPASLGLPTVPIKKLHFSYSYAAWKTSLSQKSLC